MRIIDFRRFIMSFRYAKKGFIFAYQREQNFRIQLFIGLIMVILMIVLRIKIWEAVALLLAMGSVLVLELINTIFEAIIDVMKPRMHHYVAIIKNIMAAAVLLASIGAVVIGSLILYPYFLRICRFSLSFC